ncbi:MAG: hypothetical protein R1F52_05595 [Candidatus Nitrosoabyssus spongiisocia]|nr:MAG: hypothetical protein R1F52_05595 [Nitrosopumilaceae archaeon AB1(1)]
MKFSETFGVEEGHGSDMISWLNEVAKKRKLKIEARLYNHIIKTENFGSFEMFSWIGHVSTARKIIIKASKHYKIKIIEGGYKPKEIVLTTKKTDYAMVRIGDKILGHLKFSAPLFGNGMWKLDGEERR